MRHSNLAIAFLIAVLSANLPLRAAAQIQDPAAAQAPAPAAAESPQICGNQPLCYETADFAATITNFRTSVPRGYHVIDATIRFQNKTAQQLILGYVVSSGTATDDRGNRSIVGGPNGYHGIGLVAGGNFEPKFVLRPGGFGDAQFELILQGYPQVIGFTYALDLSVAEINSFEGNQHTLGGEFPIHYEGLRNGSAAVSPMFAGGSAFGAAGSAISNPCATAGNVAGQAASTVSNAANAISSIGSIFRRKKDPQNAPQAASIPGCDPNAAAAPVTGAVAAPAAGVLTSPATAPAIQQTVSRTGVAQGAGTNPLAGTPAQPITPPTGTTPAQAGVVNAASRNAISAPPPAAHWGSATTQKPNPSPGAKPASAAAKPSPAKPTTRVQAPNQRNAAGDQK